MRKFVFFAYVILAVNSLLATEPSKKQGTTMANKKTTIRYDWVIFDYGGTLNTGLKHLENGKRNNFYGTIIQKWFKSRGYKVKYTPAELEKMTAQAHKLTSGSPNQESLLNNIEYYTEWMRCIYKLVGIKSYISHTELEAATLYMFESTINTLTGQAKPELVKLLKTLKNSGIRLAVISNNNGYVEDMVAKTGTLNFFEWVVDSARLGYIKPDPKIFQIVEKKYRLKGKKILYVGDSFSADVIGARAQNWDVAWISKQSRKLPDGVFKITTLSELIDICFGKYP